MTLPISRLLIISVKAIFVTFVMSFALEFALAKLPSIQKTVVLLRDYEAYSYHEIAEITGLNESQVKVYIFRARAFMKEFIRRPDVVV